MTIRVRVGVKFTVVVMVGSTGRNIGMEGGVWAFDDSASKTIACVAMWIKPSQVWRGRARGRVRGRKPA